MKIANLIQIIQAHPDPNGEIPEPVHQAVSTLSRRLEALLPDRATAQTIGQRVGVQPRADGSLLLAWSSVVLGCFYARRMAELYKAVQPHLPTGEAYTPQEMADEAAFAQLADVEGKADEVAEHEARLGAMVVHNARAAG